MSDPQHEQPDLTRKPPRSQDDSAAFHGSCLCGSVQFSGSDLVGPYVYCHCRSCRKASGSAFGANIATPISSFVVDKGQHLISAYESTPGKVRHFCSTCGSPLFTKVGRDARFVRVRLGALDSDFATPRSADIFLDDRASWHPPDDTVPGYPAWPDGDDVSIPGSRQRSD